ncbi:hypothetical protein FHS77_000792 [Paenochrobactrum gallinarii]|uniref:Uncharacterized protein n=1 Tax=Paenochrobactrum gallinarii TaxID=643673 RepID=A0A841M291_9HYPH|nr:hypothetical protein [Paenochrobactrum gallinarii]
MTFWAAMIFINLLGFSVLSFGHPVPLLAKVKKSVR